MRSRVLPASQLGKACDYTLGQWDKLMVYTRDGRVEIDNNWCEPEQSGDRLPQAARRASTASQNEMRPIGLGRKNWMHLGSEESGPKVAAIMTVIASAKRAGANVREYLAWVLPKLNDPATTEADLVEMLPARWLARRAEAAAQPEH